MTDSCGHTTTVALVCQVPEGGTEDRAIARGQTGSTQLGRVLLRVRGRDLGPVRRGDQWVSV